MTAITECLEAEHEKLTRLFGQLETSATVLDKERFYNMIRYELDAHIAVEEEVLYPRATRYPETAEHAKLSEKVNQEMREWIGMVDGMDPEKPEWLAEVRRLKEAFGRHVKDQNEQMFPLLRKLMSKEQLQSWGIDALRAKERLTRAA